VGTRGVGQNDCLDTDLASKSFFKHAYFDRQGLRKLAFATHDLRNPIAGILAASQYLADETAAVLNSEQREILDSIRSSSRLLLRLVDNILELSKIESGVLKLDCRPTDLLALIHQNLVANRLLGLSKGIRINLVSEKCLPEISVDPSRIAEVIDNLVTNAIKFSHPGGEISIRVARRRNMTAISVCDEGPGISEEHLQSLATSQGTFSSHNGDGCGTGLGLAIARRIVTRHGGKIEIRSKVGFGSTFTVLLPISRGRDVRQMKQVLPGTPRGGSNWSGG